jgi:hypothetical protein
MVRLPKRVLKRWRELVTDPNGYDTVIEVVLTSRLDPVAATEVLSQSLNRVLTAFEQTHNEVRPDIGEVPFAGEWSVTPVPEGALLIGGRKSDAGEEVLQGIVDDLGRHGVSGKLDLYVLPEVPSAPAGIGVIEASLRIAGQRIPGRGRPRWVPDRDALERVIQAGTNWCLEARPDRAVTLGSGANPQLLVRRCESPSERVRAVLHRDFITTFSSIGDDRYRSLVFAPRYGRVTVLEGGPCLHRAGWRPTIDALTDFLSSVCADVVYARVRREADHNRAVFPEGSHRRDRLHWYERDAIAYEDHLAPDAFAIQVLGPGYKAKVPTGDDWRRTELSNDRILLQHLDQDAWFREITLEDALKVERPWSGASVPKPAFLEQARASLAPILFPDVPREPAQETHGQEATHLDVWLPQSIVMQVDQLSPEPHPRLRAVALELNDGGVIQNVELSHDGAVVARIAGSTDFSLDPHTITAVIDSAG